MGIKKTGILPAAFLLALTACAGGRDAGVAARIHALNAEVPPQPSRFIHCYDHGCRSRAVTGLTEGEWKAVLALFAPAPETAEDERGRIREAVARMERAVGEKTGTSRDLGGTYANMFRTYQLDCADETVNVTTYLTLLDEAGLLAFHKPGGRVHRGNILDRLPHMAPVIAELETKTLWVVDAWYRDNGEPPEIVTVDVWRNEPYEVWGPTGKPARP